MTGTTQAPAGPRPRGWSGQRPGGRLGNGFFVWLLRCGGLRLAPFFVVFVAAWFVLTRSAQRRASIAFARRLGLGRGAFGGLWFAWRHFFTYGLLLLDRQAALGGRPGALAIDAQGEDMVIRACRSGRGAVLVTAHFGNWSAMGQAVARLGVPLSLLMYDGVDPGLREQLARGEAAAGFSVLATDGGAATAAAALERLRRGEAIGAMGDRGFAGRTVRVPFLGGEAAFPIGPYVLAHATEALLVVAFLLRTGPQRYTLHYVPIDVPKPTARKERDTALQACAAAFAAALGAQVRRAPLQWGNFFDLWAEAGA